MTDASKPAPRVWSEGRIVFWFVLFVVTLLVFGPPYLEAFRPPESKVGDFHQEWLSARNFAEGGPVYARQHEIAQKHFDWSAEDAGKLMPWNAHPPVSALLALPLGSMSFSNAQLVWNLANLPFLILTLVLIIRELGIAFPAEATLPLLVVILCCHPLYSQIQHAQLNILLMFFITLTWALDRRGRPIAAGAALGFAAALKLYPAFLFLVFAVDRNWRALVSGTVVVLLLHLVALAIIGRDDFETYIREVVPSLGNYQSSRQNVSLAGFWLRIFDPQAAEHVVALIQIPILGAVFSYGSRLVVVALVVWRIAIARSRFEKDRVFAVAVLGMLLVSPITWPHYFLLLAMPLAFLWQYLAGRLHRILYWLAFLLLWLPNYYFPKLFLGETEGMTLFLLGTSDVRPLHNLTLMSQPHYALLTLFVLAFSLRAPTEPVPDRAAP